MVTTHYTPLFRFALSLARDEAEAWDLVQQTFYLWARRGHQLRDPGKARGWLLTTLHREFLGERRHEQRTASVEIAKADAELPHVPADVIEHIDGQAVLQALRRVDELYRAPLALFYLEDMSYREIAGTLDVPTGTVMSRLARGKDQLRHLLCVAEDERRQKFMALRATPAAQEVPHG